MGYKISITRAENVWESEDNPISLDEWINIIEKDPDLTLTNSLSLETPFGKLEIKGEGMALWSYSEGEVCFSHLSGKICVENDDEEVIRKLKQLARQLNAKVLGDEGEEY